MGGKTPDGTVCAQGLCGGSKGTEEGREEGWREPPSVPLTFPHFLASLAPNEVFISRS